MFACADDLNISRIQMIGILVSIWLWALDNAQDGMLQGVSDKTIARVCDFPEKKAGKLMEALHKNGWLDKSNDFYTIHDWRDYAGKLMERREKDRERKKTSKISRKNSAGIPPEEPRNSCATVPIPYHTVPNHMLERKNMVDGTGATEDLTHAEGYLFTAFWNAYPEHARGEREAAWEAWKALNPTEEKAAQIMEYLGSWKESQRWVSDNGAFIPAAKNFLTPEKSYLRTKPVPAKKRECSWAPGERKPDEWEIEAIRRMLAEPDQELLDEDVVPE
jgi:hypothetical protein